MQLLHGEAQQHLDQEAAREHNQDGHRKIGLKRFIIGRALMKNELTVTVKVPGEVAQATLQSIRPEIESDLHGRSNIELAAKAGMLVLSIRAADLHALRAAANTYVRWLDMCTKLAK
jgi:tRNA threonylcarbamoyladenosine modification (KEOPS) complex  Pcc1 subunit